MMYSHYKAILASLERGEAARKARMAVNIGVSKDLHGSGIGTNVIDFIKFYFLEDNQQPRRSM
ncbi:MAG: hypothetical protein ACTTJ7_09020 [Treponema sp.]